MSDRAIDKGGDGEEGLKGGLIKLGVNFLE